MIKVSIALVLAFVIGASCRYFDIPNPAPGALIGALMVATCTVGYVVMGYYIR